MKKYLLPEKGNFYKANLHCHTTVSDGSNTPEEVKKIYMEHGYSIVAYTDHDVLIAHPELQDENFLPLNGYEMEINDENTEFCNLKTCHFCLIALEPDNLKQVCYHRSKYLFANAVNQRDKLDFYQDEPDYERVYSHECISDMMKRGRDAGFFVTYNHPVWSLERYPDYMGYENMHAMEIYNYGSICEGFPEYNEKEYDDLLQGGKRIFCIGADDNHSLKDSCGAFTVIKAEKLQYKAVTDALINGNFYASEGPQIYDLYLEDGKVHITCSDAVKIVYNTPSRRAISAKAKDGETICSAVFDVVPEDKYFRITILDETGKRANTNAYFTDEIL